MIKPERLTIFFQSGPYSAVFCVKLTNATTGVENGQVLSESVAACSQKTSCCIIFMGNCTLSKYVHQKCLYLLLI